MNGYLLKMWNEFISGLSWQWYVSQGLTNVAIIFCITAMQKTKLTDMLWHRSLYSLLLFAGVCFLGELPAMIMIGIGFVRTLVLLILSYKENATQRTRVIIFVTLALALIGLNIGFWEGWLSALSIAVGILFLLAFIQTQSKNVRRVTIVASSVAIVFYLLSFMLVNALINLAVLISTIVGILRLDKRERKYTIT